MTWKDVVGINRGNDCANLLDYSMLAMTAVDLGASAAGRIDVEAARHLRVAHGMIRARVDILMGEAKYGPLKKIGGRDVCMQVSPRPFAPFGELIPLCSQDTAELAKPDDFTRADLEKVASHDRQGFDGKLLEGLDSVIRAEIAFHKADPDEILATVGADQAEKLEHLMVAAAGIADYITHAARILKDKLNGSRHLYICTNCGHICYDMPEKCGLCEAPASLIVGYPFDPGPVIRIMEREFFSRTGTQA